ncbi:MAG: adenine phosphoribosyltransferase [Cyanobacteria bacterium]|nr:adenine phosphoribosyltransferase [Cyanobacteriota bacterium]
MPQFTPSLQALNPSASLIPISILRFAGGRSQKNLQKSIPDEISEAIRVVPNFPKPGIPFKDIMPVLKDAALFKKMIRHFAKQLKGQNVQYIVGAESRGFMLGAPLAQLMGIGFIPIRKAGKLPGEVERQTYALEYGTDTVEIQKDALKPGDKVAFIDDVLATGGTAAACLNLLGKLQANVKKTLFLIELDALKGREKLPQQQDVYSMIHEA